MDTFDDFTLDPDDAEKVAFYGLLQPLFTEHGIDIADIDQVNTWKDANKPVILRFVVTQIEDAAETFPEWVRAQATGDDTNDFPWTLWHVYPAHEVLASLLDQLRSYSNIADDLAVTLADQHDHLSVVETRIALRSALDLTPPKLLWALPNPLQTLLDVVDGVAAFIDTLADEPEGWAYRSWIDTYDRKQALDLH